MELGIGTGRLSGGATVRPAGGPQRIVWLLFVAFAANTSSPVQAQRADWRPGDRLLIGELGDLRAVAVSPRYVYAAGPAGVVVYDLVRDRWAPPLPFTYGMPVGEEPTALAYDPVSDALWVGTASGVLHTYTLGFDRWERVGPVAGNAIAFIDAAPDAVYIGAADGWQRLPRGAFIPEPVPASQVPRSVQAGAAERRGRGDPWLAASRGTLGLDPRLRRWPLTDAAAGDRQGEYWITTGGGGLVRYDSRRATAEWLPVGLPSGGAGAVAVTADRVWFGGTGQPGSGAAAATPDLDRWWRFHEEDGAPAGRVVDIAADSGAVWFAAETGLYRLDAAAAERDDALPSRAWRRFGSSDGLPADAVTSIVIAESGVWATTTRGLAIVDRTGSVTAVPAGAGRSMGRAVLARDTLWVATEAGLFVLAGAASDPAGAASTGRLRAPPGATDHPALAGPVLDVAIAADVVHALTPDGLYRRDASGWRGPERTALASVGRPHRLSANTEGVWVAGEVGVAFIGGPTVVEYMVPGDIPYGPVLAVEPAGEHLWIATPAGALRIRHR